MPSLLNLRPILNHCFAHYLSIVHFSPVMRKNVCKNVRFSSFSDIFSFWSSQFPDIFPTSGLQWLWWQRYDGGLTEKYSWLFKSKNILSKSWITHISKLSPTHFVFSIRHQHRWSILVWQIQSGRAWVKVDGPLRFNWELKTTETEWSKKVDDPVIQKWTIQKAITRLNRHLSLFTICGPSTLILLDRFIILDHFPGPSTIDLTRLTCEYFCNPK